MSDNDPLDGKARTPEGEQPQRPTPRPTTSRWREMVRQSPFSTMILDPSGRLLEVNSAFEQMWGVSAADVAGYNPLEDAQSHAQGMLPLLERAFAGETVVTPEAPYDAAQTVSRGYRRWIRTFVYPVKDDDGRVSEVVLMHEDVTARREAEEQRARHGEELGGERRRLREIVGTVPGVVWEAWGEPSASAQRIDFVSNYVEKMLGYTVEEWLSTPNFWLSIVHPEDKERAARNAAEHFAKGGAGVNRFRWVAKDGRVLHVESHSSVILDEQGRPVGMRGVTLDVTDRRRAERALRESEERLRLSQEVAHIGTFDWHVPTGRVIWTEAEERIFGLEPGTFEGSIDGWARRVVPEDAARMQAEMGQAMERGDRTMDFTFRIVRPDGSIRWIEGIGCFTYDEDGSPLHMVGVNIDVTERRQAEEEREQLLAREQQARKEAEEANRLKDEFLATLSHELRTPLTAILGWAQMLGSGALTGETARHAVEVIKRNANNQKQIVEDILDASRIITGKLRVEAEPVDLVQVVRAALDSARPAAAAKGISLSCDFDQRLSRVTGDPHRLQQVIWNLLSNAVKFTPSGGQVGLEVRRLLSQVRVTVSDTGQGIAPEFLPHVFDRFRQADSSTTRQHGGLGLGLSIVKSLVEMHGGSVHAYSAGEGLGATFTIDLPLPVYDEPGQSAPGGEEQSVNSAGDSTPYEGRGSDVPPALVGLRVLLVDDEPDTLELLGILLKRNGALVTKAASAEEAMEAVRRVRPDVLVSDVGMPGTDGYGLMRRVRSLTPEQGGLTPAIALTAYASESDRVAAFRAGFQRHLAKPVEPSTLLSEIEALAASRAASDVGDAANDA